MKMCNCLYILGKQLYKSCHLPT